MSMVFRSQHESTDASGLASVVTAAAKELAAIQKVKELIVARCAEPLSLHEIVVESGLSRFRFLRLFKRVTGVSPHEFLIRCRVDKAREFLSQGRSLIETAMDTGFFDQSHFCRHFKRVTG